MSSPAKLTSTAENTSLENLGPELLEPIFEYVYETSPSTMSSLLRVSKVCHEIALRFRDRRQVFEFKPNNRNARRGEREPKESLQRIRSLAKDNPQNSQIFKNIKYIELVSDSNWQPGSSVTTKGTGGKIWKPMAEVIAKITNLREMTFSGDHPMPSILIEALGKYHPKARLHVKNWTRISSDTDHNDLDELALARSINLRHIEATFWNGPGPDLRLPALKRIIALSPNLESAVISERSGGCVVYGFTIEEFHETKRRGKLFDVEKPSPNSIKHLVSTGSDHVTCLQDVTDISKLVRLEIGGFSDLDYFSKDGVPNSRFPALEHLTINSMWKWNEELRNAHVDTLESFLVSCKPLTTLGLTGFESSNLDKILMCHGSSLQNLKIHCEESPSKEHQRKMLSNTTLLKINEICPMLRDITVDINRSPDGSTEQEIITILSTFSHLHTVRFYIDLGIADEDDPMPSVSCTTNPFYISDDQFIPNIWSLLSSQKAHNGTAPLKALHIKVGEWERETGGGYPASWVIWESSNRLYFVATPGDRDDRPNEIFVEKHTRWSGLKKRGVMNVPEVVRASRLVRQKSPHEIMSEIYHKEQEERFKDGLGF